MSNGGRPSKYNAARLRAILDAIQAGETRSGAARSAGVSRSTFQYWLARGRAGEVAFIALAEAVRLARVAKIQEHNARFWSRRVIQLEVRQSMRGFRS